MSNSPLVDYVQISPNKTLSRKGSISKITIHHMAGNLTVEECGNVFAPSSRRASSNYGIGSDGRVGMYVEEKDRSWASSSSANDNVAVTIEVADDEIGGNWHVSDAALAKTIDLCVDICQRNGISKLNFTGDKTGNLTMHQYFAPTACPGPYLKSKFSYIAQEVNARLEDDNMDVSRFKELFNEMRKDLQDNDSGTYSKEAREWALENKLIVGNGIDANGEPNCMWADVLTREQFITVLYRFAKMMSHEN